MATELTGDQLVYGLIGVGDPQIAPDGSLISFVQSQASPDKPRAASRLYEIAADGSGLAPISDETASASCPRWSPDGASLAWVHRLDGVSAIAIRTNGEISAYATPTTPNELAWSADGRQIAFVRMFDPENPDNTPVDSSAAPAVRVVRRIDYKQENRGFLNDARNCVFVLDVATGEFRQLTNDRTDHLAPAWSPDGSLIATKTSVSNGMTSQLCVISVTDGSKRVFGEAGGFISTWSFTPDGSGLIYSGDTTQTWQADWFLVDLAAGTTRRLTDDLTLAVDGGFPTVSLPAQPSWEDDTHLIYHGVLRGQSAIASLDITSGASEVVATWPAVHGGWSATNGAGSVAQIRTTPDHPGVLVLVDIATGNATTVYDPNTSEPWASPACTSERITINRLGYDMDGWLILPADHDGQKPLSLIINIHGGPNAQHGPMFDLVSLAMVGAGFAVLTTNPRGSTSYGRAFTNAVRNDWAGEDYNDQMAFLNAVTERPYLDKDRLGVYGYSYGGYMSSWIVGHTDMFKAAVIGAPVVDLTSFYGTADIGHNFGPMQIGGTPWDNADEYRKRSPLTNLHTATTPSLIVHGENDDRVPIGQGEQIFMTLHEAGCEVEFVRYPTGAHAMLRTGFPAHRADYYARVPEWFARYLPVD